VPTVRNYKEGSVIYFENDKSDEIYILKSGRVVLLTTSPETNEEVKEEIKTGEFFAIKSVLGNYKREETAQCLTQTVVLIFTQAEFEGLISKNFDILLKLLKVFSNQLRRVGKKVRELLDHGEQKLPSTELFNIGEYYYKRAKKEQALYAYKKYMEFYPTGEFFGKARERVSQVNAGQMGASVSIPRAMESDRTPSASDDSFSSPTADMDMPSMDVNSMPREDEGEFHTDEGFESPLSGLENLGQEVDDQWKEPAKRGPAARQSSGGGAADGSSAAPAGGEQKPMKTQGLDIAKKYYDGLSMFSQEKFEDAVKLFSEVLAYPNVKDEADLKFVEKSHFDKGRCLIKTEKFQDAITELTAFIKRFPKSEHLKESFYLIGECYESMKNPQKAANFYQKVIGMPPRESINNKAKQKLEALRGKL
jgi:CRP-like cAMP-binding protein/TolA-binding protein